MDIVAFRSAYTDPTTRAQHIEWFIMTNWGTGLFKITDTGNRRPRFSVETELKPFPHARNQGINGARQHIFFKRMCKRAADAGTVVNAAHPASFEEMEAEWGLEGLFSFDERAKNAWSNLTGRQIGVSFEKIASDAEKIKQEQRQQLLHEQAVQRAAVDDSWGIF